MKTAQIVAEELKSAGLEIMEDSLVKVINCLSDKILPRLALEADEAAVKAVASVGIIVISALKPAILGAVDKIDGQIG
jgi:hypothetical protein